MTAAVPYHVRAVIALALLIVGLPAAIAVQLTQFDHLTTGYELRGAHRDLSCEYCHMKGVFKGTPRTCEGCHTTGSRISATPRPPTHIATQGSCVLCHAEYNFLPVVHVDHSVTLGSCFSCHNGVVAEGKHPDHIPSDNNCDACHTTNAFNPARVEHASLAAKASACRSCHTGVTAASLPRDHVPTTAECGSCHSTLSWNPARFDHSAIVGTCQSCHNGSTATGKPAGHMTTARDCSTCHRYPRWNVVFAHSSGEYPGDHRGAPACGACHSTNTEQATWKFAAYRPNCGGCHAGEFKPEGHDKTSGGVKYNLSELQNCSGACHIYTDIGMRAIAKARPAGHHKVTDGAFH